MKKVVGISLIMVSILWGTNISQVPENAGLVVYNSNVGLIHERRKVHLDAGKQSLIYPDVADSVMTDSVNVHFPKEVTLFSQQYRYDKITAHKVAEAHIGKTVDFYYHDGDERHFGSGTLLSAGQMALVDMGKEGIYTVSASSLIFSDIPSQLITKPSLVWNVDVAQAVDDEMTLEYLVENISWKSDYVMNLTENRADLVGWMTIDNRSGKAYESVELMALAGDVNRVQRSKRRGRSMKYAYAAATRVDEVTTQPHEGYHLYKVPFKVTLANNEKTQIKFFHEQNVTITRHYSVQMPSPIHFKGEQTKKVDQSIRIAALERALPGGIIRTYSKAGDDVLLIGETSIKHTPRHEEIVVRLGSNFDMKVKTKSVARNVTRDYYDVKIAYEVINRSQDDRKIDVMIPFTRRNDGRGAIETEHPYAFKNGDMLQFSVSVEADGVKRFDVHFLQPK